MFYAVTLHPLRRPKLCTPGTEPSVELLSGIVDYSGNDCSTTVRPFRRDQVSLPDPGRPSADLLNTLPEPDQDLLKAWDTHMLADPADVGFYRESGHQFRLYFDEVFKTQRGVYVEFLRDLSDVKMIGWTYWRMAGF